MTQPRSRRLPRPRTLLTLLGLVLLVAGCAFGLAALRGGPPPAERRFSLIVPRYDTLVATVNAAGQIEPARVVSLSFNATGRVREVLVAVGERVEQGQVLARLDDRELRLRADQAEAQLRQAQASYDRLLAGASAADIAAAEAQLRQAAGQLQQVEGSVTEADLRAAEQQLRQAQALLARLLGSPNQSDVQAAEARVREAEIALERQRTQLSANKTAAATQLEQAVSQLTQAQSRYATAKQHWDYVQQTGADPLVREVSDPARPGRTRPNKLNDSQRQQYYDAFVQAEAALRSAESAVAQAQVAYDNARQAEASGVELAEGELRVARAQRDQLFAAGTPEQVAQARAQVAAAQASLEKLRGAQRAGALEVARAALASAQANLEQLRAGPDPSDLAVAQAQLDAARAGAGLARLALEGAALTAPFSGTVAEVNLREGETPAPTLPAVVLADLSSFTVDVTVDEIDVARIAAGQPVTLTLDALPDLTLRGEVLSIAPLAEEEAAVTSYRVRVGAGAPDPRVRAGMSAGADIVVARREGALLVPRRAVRADRGRLLVDVTRDPALCARPREALPADLGLTPREVTTGLSNEQTIEITGGLDPQSCVYVEGFDSRLTIFGGPPGRRSP
ncbi:MAG TPA: efflux RND transporter periplasmic adaptor subunit [Roseiflexaceae bacterium]|nr:efflux RND transporter periplasmic adaptor subunit [Roseiflexaceae bacterium]